MRERLANYIEQEGLRQSHQKVLLAASGGIDSTVLAHLFKALSLPFALAHVNYKLRGTDSDADAAFVTQLAHQLKVPVFSTELPIDTDQLAGDSLQMRARDLRYSWLEQLRQAEGYHLIATAHQANDNVETLLLNIVKGTGIKGLHGILPRNGVRIRPLLWATREEIRAYAKAHQISYREDATNATMAYQRNFIRHEVLPKLAELNPSVINTMQDNIQRWRHVEALYEQRLEDYRKKLLDQRGKEIYIPLRRLLSYSHPVQLLYALLADKGFHTDQLTKILALSTDTAGQVVYSEQYQLVKHRRFLILAHRDSQQASRVWLSAKQDQVTLPTGTLQLKVEPWQWGRTIPKDRHIALLDAEKVEWPLLIRPWATGDYCYPLGMTKRDSDKVGKKKLSDLMTDLKLSKLDKEKVQVLQSGERIAWVLPYRIDDRFKITPSTRQVVRLRWIPSG